MPLFADGIGGITTPQIIFLFGLSLVIMILLVRSRRHFRRVTQLQVPAPPAAQPKKTTQLAGRTREHEQWEVAMHDLARDLSGQLDSKIRVLELLIREANQVATRLESAVKRADSGRMTRLPPREEVFGGDRSLSIPLDKPAAPESPKPAAVPATAVPKEKVRRAAPLGVANNPRFERIYALADAGLSSTTIATQIGGQVGEVELVLSLRGTQPSG